MNINIVGPTFSYTFPFDLYALQPLKNDEDLTNMFQFSDRFARVYLCLASIVEDDETIENGGQETKIVQVHTFRNEHNHSLENVSILNQIRCNRATTMIDDVIRSNPDYLPHQICKDFRRQYGMQLNYFQAWNLKEKAKERIHGVLQCSYKLLPWLCTRLIETNPRTIVEYRCSDDAHFMQLFVALSVSIHGFQMGCRPIISIDSSHMSGPYKGALFSASSYDADDGMFPLAYALFSSENYEDWLWFLEKLRYFLTKLNTKERKWKENALQMLDSIAYARLDCDYEVAMDTLRTFNHDLAKWVEENNPQHWAISKFKKMRWDKMTSNLASLSILGYDMNDTITFVFSSSSIWIS
ncbi:hypothetical protein AAG906_015898 [Vitis piasezkii]